VSVAVTAKKPTDSMFTHLKEGTQHMDIYQPYFYIIQDKRNSMYYAGSKYGKGADPANFMIEGGYTTYSNTINELIRQHGLDNFLIRRIRTFETAEQAFGYETRFLMKVDARNNTSFYNGHNNDFCFSHEKIKAIMQVRYGVDNAMHVDSIKDKVRATTFVNYGVEHTMQSEELKEKRRNTLLERYGVEHPLQNKTIKEKFYQTMITNHGVDNPMRSSELKEKREETVRKKYGKNHFFQTDIMKENRRNTMLERYGVEHPAQLDRIIKKRAETTLKRYGVESYSELEESKERNRKLLKIKYERPQVKIIKEYNRIFKLKPGNGWHMKSDDFLNKMLEELEIKYGPIAII
jgi:hypothetical protein